MPIHTPIMVHEVLEGLMIESDDVVFDGTIGFGGHAQTFIERLSSEGIFIGCDKDPQALKHCSETLVKSAHHHLFHGSYADVNHYLDRLSPERYTKLFIDCGMSSYQLDHPERG